jgi:lipid-binding SYLF domain-containing protein
LQARIDAAKVVLDEIMAAQDKSIPMNILEQATCVGVVPGMKKGAFVLGRAVWPGSGHLPHRPRLERAGIHSHGWRLVRLPDRRPVH